MRGMLTYLINKKTPVHLAWVESSKLQLISSTWNHHLPIFSKLDRADGVFKRNPYFCEIHFGNILREPSTEKITDDGVLRIQPLLPSLKFEIIPDLHLVN